MSGGTASVQIRNSELVDLLSTDFIRRNEASVAWGNLHSIFNLLPGLRGFWPMSSVDESGWVYDQSGQERVLKYTGNPLFSLSGLAPYIEFDGTGDELFRPDEVGLDITGGETFMATALRGLTLGGWFYFTDVAPGHNMSLIAKWNTSGDQRSYLLWWNDTGNYPSFSVTNLGTAADVDSVASTVGTVANTWYFIVGRYDPSAELAIFVNGTKTTNVVGIPATLFSGTSLFEIGANSAGAAELLHGGTSLCFLCSAALPDTAIQALYHHSRAMHGG